MKGWMCYGQPQTNLIIWIICVLKKIKNVKKKKKKEKGAVCSAFWNLVEISHIVLKNGYSTFLPIDGLLIDTYTSTKSNAIL